MKDEVDINLNPVMDRFFDKTPLTKGEWIIIILTIILIITMICVFFMTTCQLDCSMCTSKTQVLYQSGFEG